jgi:hypothetical protein
MFNLEKTVAPPRIHFNTPLRGTPGTQRKTSAWIYQRLNPLGVVDQTGLSPSFASLVSLAVNELPDLGLNYMSRISG